MGNEVMSASKDTLTARLAYAEQLSKSDLLPKSYQRQPQNVLLAIEYGHALGIPTIQAINSINVIDGRPAMSAGLMSALVRKNGCKLRVKVQGKGKEAIATAVLVRPDDDYEFTCSWDWARAEAAGAIYGFDKKKQQRIIKANWANYPEAMLKARAISEVCREGAEDILHGFTYTKEEVEYEAIESVELVNEPQPEPEPVQEANSEAVDGMISLARSKGFSDDDIQKAASIISGDRTSNPYGLTADEVGRLVVSLEGKENRNSE